MSAYQFPDMKVASGTLHLLMWNNDTLGSGILSLTDQMVISVAKLSRSVELSGFGGEMRIDDMEIEMTDRIDIGSVGGGTGGYIISDSLLNGLTLIHPSTPQQCFAYIYLTDNNGVDHYVIYGRVATSDSPMQKTFIYEDDAIGAQFAVQRTVKFRIQSFLRILEDYSVFQLRDWLGHNNQWLSQNTDDNRWYIKPVDIIRAMFEGNASVSGSGIFGGMPTNNGVPVPMLDIVADTWVAQRWNSPDQSSIQWKDLWTRFSNDSTTFPVSGQFEAFWDETTSYSFTGLGDLRKLLFTLCGDINAYPHIEYQVVLGTPTLILQLRQRVTATAGDETTLGLNLDRQETFFYGYEGYMAKGIGTADQTFNSGGVDYFAFPRRSAYSSSPATIFQLDFDRLQHTIRLDQWITIDGERTDATVSPNDIDYWTAHVTGANTINNVVAVTEIHDPDLNGGLTQNFMASWRARYALRAFSGIVIEVKKTYSDIATGGDVRPLDRFTTNTAAMPTNDKFVVIDETFDYMENTKQLTMVNYKL